MTLVLALCTFLAVNLFGTREYWKEIFWPEVPAWLKVPVPMMPAIELVGIFTKPFALMIRLFANMMAGHAVILSLTCVIFVTVSMGAAVNASMTFVSVLFIIFMNLLELLVAFLQAYVFTMLSAVFIGTGAGSARAARGGGNLTFRTGTEARGRRRIEVTEDFLKMRNDEIGRLLIRNNNI